MNIQSAISKEIFIPRDERMLVAVEVQRRKRKRMSFLPTGAKGDYITFICVSVTNKRPHQLLITKVKQFVGSPSFTRRSQWTVEQLRQVNGINPNKDSPEFDLVFDSTVDQWVASSSAEKCIFIQILYHTCQTYWEGKVGKLGKVGHKGRKSQHAHQEGGAGPSDSPPGPASRTLQARRKSYVPPKQTEFINCQSKLTGDACTMNLVIYRCMAFFNRLKNTMVANQRSPGRGLDHVLLKEERPYNSTIPSLSKHLKTGATKTAFYQTETSNRTKLNGGQTSVSTGWVQPGQRVTGSTMGNVVQRMNVSLGERGDRLTRAEDKTVELMHKAQQFADTAHKMALKHSK